MKYKLISSVLLATALLTTPSVFAQAKGPQLIERISFVNELYHNWGVPGQLQETPFLDVSPDDTVVAWAYTNGIISGDGAGHFMPNDPLTREQAAVMLANYAKLFDIPAPPHGISGLELRDYHEISDWAIPGVDYCYNAGIIPPAQTSSDVDFFDPQALVNREDALSMLHALLELANAV